MELAKIQRTDKVWNPVTGCSNVSHGRHNCYAERFSDRLKKIKGTRKEHFNGFRPTVHPDNLTIPYHWKKPCTISVCSMGDLFHESIPFEFIGRVLKVIIDCNCHDFRLLTKRPERMREFFIDYMPVKQNIKSDTINNLWLGVSVEDQMTARERVPELLRIPCQKRFVSCDPLLGEVSLHTFDINTQLNSHKRIGEMIHLVIAGYETGPGARSTPLYHIVDLAMDCDFLNIPIIIKNIGNNPEGMKLEILTNHVFTKSQQHDNRTKR
jgi:protein gp37